MTAGTISSRGAASGLHPLIRGAGAGRLPPWARVGSKRRAHLDRVADLMGSWAETLGRPEEEALRWRAAGLLHDVMKGDDPDELRIWAGEDWPEPLLHGPAIAARLRAEGVRDDELLMALSHHSVGHPAFGELGQFLYLADFLDPARRFRKRRRAALRERLPEQRGEVLVEAVALKLGHLISDRHAILPVSLRFWNRLVGEGGSR